MHERTPLPVFSGAREPKSLVRASVGGEPHTTSLIERTLHVDETAKNWHALREAGLPVPPTMYTSEEERFFMADVKADGSETYGKQAAWALWGDVDRIYPKSDIDDIFLRLFRSRRKWREVQEKLDWYCENADAKGIALPSDPMELILHPDGTWDYIVLDLGDAAHEVENPRNVAHRLVQIESSLFYIGQTLVARAANQKPRRQRWI